MTSKLHVTQRSEYMGDDWWRWSVWIEGPPTELDAVESVTWHLHPTFSPPVVQRASRADKFRLDKQGWGSFTIRAVLKRGERPPIRLSHDLELVYPESPKSEERSLSRDYYSSKPVEVAKMNQPLVYIAHSFADSDVVRPLSDSLRKRGIKVELPEESAVSGDSLESSIQRSIESSDAVIAVTSAASGTWVNLEAGLASEKSKRVFNLVLDEVAPLKLATDLVLHLERGPNAAEIAEASDRIADRIADVLGQSLTSTRGEG